MKQKREQKREAGRVRRPKLILVAGRRFVLNTSTYLRIPDGKRDFIKVLFDLKINDKCYE